MNDSAREQYKKMTATPVSRLILTLGLPTTISMLVTNIYNMADTYFVSQIGTSASGAVGVVFGLMAVLQAIGFMFGHGAGSIISRELGAKDVEDASKYASTSFFCSIGIGALIAVFGIIFIDGFMRVLGSTDTILPYARTYGFYILLSAPLMTSSFVMNNILRYEGRASFAMIGITVGGVLNIFGDWFLITRMGMGVRGAGISTAVSQAVSFALLLSIFLSGKTQSKISPFNISRDISAVALICATGFPSLIRQGLGSVSTMVLNGQAGVYGDAAVAAMSIVNRICFFLFAAGLGIGQGFQPVAAFNYGAGKYSRVKRGFYFTLAAGEVFLGCLAVGGMFVSGELIELFRNDPEVIRIGTFALRAQLISLFFQPFILCSSMLLQSTGQNRPASFLSTLRSGLCFIPTLLILARFAGLWGIGVAQTVSDIMTFVITIPFPLRFMRGFPEDEEEPGEKI